MRFEALQANFDTHLTAGEMPPDEALAFALAGQPFEMDLKGQDAMAFEYAMAAAGMSGSTDTNGGVRDPRCGRWPPLRTERAGPGEARRGDASPGGVGGAPWRPGG